MLSGVVEGGAAIIIAVAGGLIIFGQLKNNAERNAQDIEAIKIMMHDFQEDMKDLISKNLKDVKDLIDANKENQRDSLEREISHIKDLLNVSSVETREDIKRLEAAQRESNKIKERLALAEASLRSLHKRLDIEPPINIHDNND
jgi:gas vesicle protein